MIVMSSSQLRYVRYLRCDPKVFLSCKFQRNIVISRTLYSYPMVYTFHLKFSDLLLSARKSLYKSHVRTYSLNSKTKCWNCDKNLENFKFSCVSCGVLQHPNPDMNFFELMDLPENFDLDVDDISSKYKALQKLFHPDKYVQKSKEEIGISDTYSRLVNKAYSTLKNPLSRGLYILNLNGIDTDDGSVKMEQEFLMDILETNEALEKVDDAEVLQKMYETNLKVILDFQTMASKAFQVNDLPSAREALMRMKYFVNIENEIKKKKSEMGVVD